VEVAHEWRISNPSDYFNLPYEERVIMTAYVRMRNKIQIFSREIADTKQRSKAKKRK